ncbi:MAG: DEAD/DEAH box helicase family protein [Marinomonas gallaica]
MKPKKQDRDYQAEILLEAKQMIKESDEPFIIEAYVGAGKSYMAARLAEYLNRFGMSTLVMARQVKLVNQNSEEAWSGVGLKNSVYKTGRSQLYPVVYATEGTLANGLDTVFAPDSDFMKGLKNGCFDMIIYDECQLWPFDSPDSNCMKVYNHFKAINPKLRLIGLSGSPFRGTELIYPQEGWNKDLYFWKRKTEANAGRDRLIRDNWLVPIEYGLHNQVESIDYSGLEVSENAKTGGDYSEDTVNEILEGEWQKTFGICQHVYQRSQNHSLGVLIFGASRFHTKQIKQGLISAGAKPSEIAIVLDDTTDDERDIVCEKMENGEIKYAINISVMSVGWDISRVGHIVFMRPVRVPAFFIQAAGRGVRSYLADEVKYHFNVTATKEERGEILAASEKPCCIVDDYAGIMEAIGSLIDDPQFEEAQAKKDKDDGETIPCPVCNFENGVHAVRCANTFGDGSRCDHFFKFTECPKCGVPNAPTAQNCRDCGATMRDPNKALLNKVYVDGEFRPCAKMTLTPNKNETGIIVEWHLKEPDESLGRVKTHYSLTSDLGKRIWYNEIVKKYVKPSPMRNNMYKFGVKGVLKMAACFDQPIEIAVRKNDKGEFRVRPKFAKTGVPADETA